MKMGMIYQSLATCRGISILHQIECILNQIECIFNQIECILTALTTISRGIDVSFPLGMVDRKWSKVILGFGLITMKIINCEWTCNRGWSVG